MKKILKIEIWRREEGKDEKISEKQNHCVNLCLYGLNNLVLHFFASTKSILNHILRMVQMYNKEQLAHTLAFSLYILILEAKSLKT